MAEIKTETIKTLVKLLWTFFILDFLFEMIEVAVHAYGGTEGWHHVSAALSGPLSWSFWDYAGTDTFYHTILDPWMVIFG